MAAAAGSTIEDDYNAICCPICLDSDTSKPFILGAGLCKFPTHAECLREAMNYRLSSTCTVCKANIPFNDSIHRFYTDDDFHTHSIEEGLVAFFPQHDIYPAHVKGWFSDAPLEKKTGVDRLYSAIAFLQLDRVKELIKDEAILKELPRKYFGHPSHKLTAIIALCCGNLSNDVHISLGNNRQMYEKILRLLIATSKIDLYHVDLFGKSAFDRKEYIDLSKFI